MEYVSRGPLPPLIEGSMVEKRNGLGEFSSVRRYAGGGKVGMVGTPYFVPSWKSR